MLTVALLLTIAAFAMIELRERQNLELDYHPLTRAQQLVDEGRYAEAQVITRYVIEEPSLAADSQELTLVKNLNASISDELDSVGGKVRRFVKGAISGEPRDLAGFLGSMSLDLFVIGDIRDLIVQGTKEIRGEDGDKIILALSAAGLATTVAPQVDWAPSLMKGFRRAGALSTRFAKRFGKLCRQALKAGDFKSVARVTENFGTAAAKIGPGPMMGVMKRIDEPASLARIAKASQINPGATYMVVSGTGTRGLKQISNSGSNIGALAKRLKYSSRLVKQLRKSTMIIPTIALQLIAVISLFLALWLLVRWLVARGFTKRRRL